MSFFFSRKLIESILSSHVFRPEYFFFDRELLNLSKTLISQSLLKHILTEGDKMMMTEFTSTADQDQGVYAFVVNYGKVIKIRV